jgi:tetratricopeptide (TPR) repeat protein
VSLAAFLVYLPALGGSFLNWDDDIYVVQNRAIRELNGGTVAWAATTFHAYNWHPLTWLSHAVDYALYGPAPRGHHLTSVLLHALNSGLLLWALWRLTGAAVPAAATAALFALHPLHVESGAWVAERRDVLSTLFWVLALIAYAAWVERGRWWRYGLVLASFTCGLLAKPMVVTLPFLLLLLDYWPLRRLSRRAVVEKLPLLLLAAASSFVTVLAQQAGGSAMSVRQFDLPSRVANAVVSYGAYLGQTAWPATLVHYHPLGPDFVDRHRVALAGSALLLVAISAASWVLRRKAPYLITGWLWYLGTLVPVIGLVQVGMQSRADRYTYVPLIGIFMMIAWGGWELARRGPARMAYGAIAALVLLACAVRTTARIGDWRDSVRLWTQAADVYADNGEIRYKLGQALTAAGRHDDAAQQYQRAIELQARPTGALGNLGNYFYRRGDLERAAALYQRSIDLEPRQASAYARLAAVRTGQQRLDEAAALCEAALSHDPAHVEALNICGVVRAHRGEIEGAVALWERALAGEPESIDAHLNLARAAEIRGRRDQAVRHYEAVLRVDPSHPAARQQRSRLRGP